MRKQFIILLMIGLSSPLLAQQLSREQYIRKYYQIAILEMQSYGIPASITMAQGILESGNGNTYLATEANNHFGIKCHDWTGPSVRKDDDEKDECFRKYDNPIKSYEDHSKFLTSRPRYAFLFDLDPTHYKSWAKGLKKAGYATDPKYPDKLIKIIEENELYLLDTYAFAGNPRKSKLPRAIIRHPEITVADVTPVENKTTESIIVPQEIVSIKQKIHTANNGIHYIIMQEETSYEAIALEYNLHLWEVYKFNDIDKRWADSPALGERIYLERKRSKVKKGKLTHTVVDGETMHEISQHYALKLKSLYRINEMDKGTQPQTGKKIKLNKKARF